MDDLTDDSLMPIGKYKDLAMYQVPISYFHWFYEQPIRNQMMGWNRKVREYIEKNHKKLGIVLKATK